MTTKPPPLVLVEWEDATQLDAGPWASNEPVDYKPKVFQQVGFLISDTPDGVILTHAWSDDLVAARDQIPRGMIRSIQTIRLQKAR